MDKLKAKALSTINDILTGMENKQSTKVQLTETLRLSGYFVYPWLFRLDIVSVNRQPLTLKEEK